MTGRILTATLCVSLTGTALAQVLTLQTTVAGGGIANRFMFDITALDPAGIYLNFFAIPCGTQHPTVHLWTRPDSYVGHDLSSNGWTLIATDYIGCIGSGLITATTLNYRRLDVGHTLGVFIETQVSPLLPYSPIPPAQTSYSNAHLRISGGAVKIGPGFPGTTIPASMWNGAITYRVGAPGCFANCDNSTISPVLNSNDFQCFIDIFAGLSSRSNCDRSTNSPMLNINDFMFFINAYAAGCTAP